MAANQDDLPLRCKCGAVRGVAREVIPRHVNRVICYCRFCQAYARHLGHAEELLDELGGTAIFQIAPGRLEITEGLDKVACVSLTRKGPLRWSAGCCNTPIANTLRTPNLPFIGVLVACIDSAELSGSLDDHLGPVLVGVNSSFEGEQARDLKATRWHFTKMMARYGWMLTKWRFSADKRRFTFFDSQTGEPIIEPVLLPKSVSATP